MDLQVGKKIDSILYVEDETILRDEMSSFLQNFCTNLYVAQDGLEALSLFQKHENIQLVVTDIGLPGISGLELLEEMRKKEQDQVFIVISAYDETDILLQAIDLQVEGFFIKPVPF